MTQTHAINRLITQYGVYDVTGMPFDTFARDGLTLLFFTGDPIRYREIDDVAVVLMELIKTFAGHFRCAIIDPDRDAPAAVRFGVTIRPTLVFVYDGAVVSSLPRMRDWSEYVEKISLCPGFPKPCQVPPVGV